MDTKYFASADCQKAAPCAIRSDWALNGCFLKARTSALEQIELKRARHKRDSGPYSSHRTVPCPHD